MDRDLRLGRRDDGVGDAVCEVGTEVGVQIEAGPDRGDVGARKWADGQLRNVLVPRVVGREHAATSGAGAVGVLRCGQRDRCGGQGESGGEDRDSATGAAQAARLARAAWHPRIGRPASGTRHLVAWWQAADVGSAGVRGRAARRGRFAGHGTRGTLRSTSADTSPRSRAGRPALARSGGAAGRLSRDRGSARRPAHRSRARRHRPPQARRTARASRVRCAAPRLRRRGRRRARWRERFR